MLSQSTGTCFLASHSPIALSSKLGNRFHVHRGISGDILVSTIASSDLTSMSAQQLGLNVSELIGGIDLVLAVEGLHDKLVLEHFMNLDSRFSHLKIHIAAIGGVKNSTNLLDVEFILEYTDLRILTVVDNVSKTELFESRREITKRLHAGEDPARQAQFLRGRSKELRKQQWFEQASMFDLLATATERGLLGRIEMSGHTYADIEMALPPQLFGINREWTDLEQEHRLYKQSSSKNTLNFKDYLRANHKVSIDKRTIQKALSNCREVPLGISALLDDVLSTKEAFSWGNAL